MGPAQFPLPSNGAQASPGFGIRPLTLCSLYKNLTTVRLCPGRIVRERSGLVGKYVRSIPVEHVSGAQFELHEYLIRKPVLGFTRWGRRFVLDTGEEAQPVNANTFARCCQTNAHISPIGRPVSLMSRIS